jgi:hypothetical protein
MFKKGSSRPNQLVYRKILKLKNVQNLKVLNGSARRFFILTGRLLMVGVTGWKTWLKNKNTNAKYVIKLETLEAPGGFYK